MHVINTWTIVIITDARVMHRAARHSMTGLCQQSQTHACRIDLYGREVGRRASTILLQVSCRTGVGGGCVFCIHLLVLLLLFQFRNALSYLLHLECNGRWAVSWLTAESLSDVLHLSSQAWVLPVQPRPSVALVHHGLGQRGKQMSSVYLTGRLKLLNKCKCGSWTFVT